MAFGFTAHNLTMMGHELSLLWPDREFCPCLNALELSRMLRGRPEGLSLLLNLSREFHEMDSALRMAATHGVPTIGAVAVDFINAYGLRLCMEQELPVVLGDLDGLEELGEARDAIRAGRRFVSRSVLRGGGFTFVDRPVCLDLLTETEALCMDAKLAGLLQKEAAVQLGLTPSSVGTYTARAFGKLGVKSGEELVWQLAGRPAGCYHGMRGGQPRRLFPLGRTGCACSGRKKPEQAEA